MTNPDINPYRAPMVSDVGPERRNNVKPSGFRGCAALQCLIILGGLFAAFLSIKSILGSGPGVTLVGIATAVLAKRGRSWSGLVFGISGPAISVFCFALIYVVGWGPSEAQDPISMIVLSYGVLALPLGLYTIFRGCVVSSDEVARAVPT